MEADLPRTSGSLSMVDARKEFSAHDKLRMPRKRRKVNDLLVHQATTTKEFCSLDRTMPPELWRSVLSYLGYRDLVCSVQKTSKECYGLVRQTGTWRNTLFLTAGRWEMSPVADENNNRVFRLLGKSMCSHDSRDPRCVPRPTCHAFDAFRATPFSLCGLASEDNSFMQCNPSLTVSLCDVENDQQVREDLMFIRDTSFEFSQDGSLLVISRGKDKFGHYIVTGRAMPSKRRDGTVENLLSGTIVIARRYIPRNDPRSRWSLSHIAQVVRACATVDSLPWHCTAFHVDYPFGVTSEISKCLSPALRMITPDGKPFRLQLTVNCVSGMVCANTTWMNQCWGCGGPNIDCQWNFRCVQLSNDGEDVAFYMEDVAQFCNATCVLSVTPKLVEMSREWKRTAKSGYLLCLMSTDDSFWDLMEDHCENMSEMKSNGWLFDDAEDMWVLRSSEGWDELAGSVTISA